MPSAVQPSQLLRAAWVAPMDRPVIADGAVIFAGGRIAAVGSFTDVRRDYPNAPTSDLGGVLLLPGLVNAHVHLELTLSRRAPAATWAGTFADWLLDLMRHAPPPGELPSITAAAVAEGVRQCLRFGVTRVGDISRLPTLTRPLLRDGPLRVTSFGEVAALAGRRGLLAERLAAATDPAFASERLRIGVSPHAPYTVEPEGYRRCLASGLPLATHLAETADEAPFLAAHAGPFRRLWDTLGAWDDAVPTFAAGPVRFAQSLGLLDAPAVLAHVNYCDDAELAILAVGWAGVVYCPRTHAYFGHPPHRWRDMLARGINVALGTDSCASSPDLNLVDDLRLVHRLAPDVPADELWQMVTVRAADVLGVGEDAGSLTVGKVADAAAFDVHGPDPLADVLESPTLPCGVWIEGERLYPF